MTATERFRRDLRDDLIEEARQMVRDGDATVDEARAWLTEQGIQLKPRTGSTN
jgi:hypothetical protein